MAFGGAYRGMGMGQYASWGRYNSDQMLQADVNLRLGGAASSAANRAGAAVRLAQQAQVGDNTGIEALDPNSDFAKYVQAVQSASVTGQTQWLDSSGKSRSVNLSAAEIGSSTVQSRAFGGMANHTVVFCLPGSTGACRTGWNGILSSQLDSRHGPCNFSALALGKPDRPFSRIDEIIGERSER
jgi:hypothetical protein